MYLLGCPLLSVICLSGVICHNADDDNVVVFVRCLCDFVVCLSKFKRRMHGDVVSVAVVVVGVVFLRDGCYCL